MISIIPLEGIPILENESQLWESLIDALREVGKDGDVLVCAHTPFSRVMGYKHHIESIKPSQEAIKLANELEKDPKKIEIILRASSKIVKYGRHVLITENKAGIVCANGGVDESNAELGYAVTVPDDPDGLAHRVRNMVTEKLKIEIGVIISDTVGRALRKGAVNIAIGVAGLNAMRSDISKKDLFGYEMRVSEIAVADELASAAELLQGQTDEGLPFILIRGFNRNYTGYEKARELNRPEEERLFK